MRFEDDDEVIGMQMQSQGDSLLVVSENGMGKRTMITEFSAQNRGGKGVICYKCTDKTGYLVGAKLVNDGREIMIITTEGIIIRMTVDDISVIGRNTSGVKLMSIDQDSDIKGGKKGVGGKALPRTAMYMMKSITRKRTGILKKRVKQM